MRRRIENSLLRSVDNVLLLIQMSVFCCMRRHIEPNAGQLGPRTTRTETNRPVSEDKSARKRGLVGPYIKTTRTVLLFYNIVQYLLIYLKDNYYLLVKMNYLLNDNTK
jgi:hypothetical protein